MYKDQDIIQIQNNGSFIYKVIEDVIYYSLECSQTNSHTKEHYQGLKKSIVSIKSGLIFISWLNTYTVQTSADIELGKIFSILELQNKLRNQRK